MAEGPFVVEAQRRVPVAREVDVVVAGAGCAGVFAALAAARGGARTLLIERFGTLGGNVGSGMIYGCVDPLLESQHVMGGLCSIVREFNQRLQERCAGLPFVRPVFASHFADLASRMMAEAGVELMLCATVADPIVEEGMVRGVFVETRSGRVAVRCRTVIDDTAQAELAMRAGAPMIRHVPGDPDFSPVILSRYRQPAYRNWNETGLVFLVTGIDWDRYLAFLGDDKATLAEGLPPIEPNGIVNTADPSINPAFRYPAKLLPALREEYDRGPYRLARPFRPGAGLFWQPNMNCPERGFIRIGQDGGEGTVIIYGDVDVDDWEQVSRAEAELRRHAYDTTDFMRRHAPGFENAWVLFTAPFISARGGPCIRGEHVVTPHDIVTGARFPDVLMRAMWEAVARKVHQNSKATPLTVGGYDVPYRMMLPQGLDGLLVVGRGSAYIRRGHDPGTRGRILQFHLGEAAGVAAALAAADGVTPRSLDTRRLQRELLRRGFWLGEPERLRELGLAE